MHTAKHTPRNTANNSASKRGGAVYAIIDGTIWPANTEAQVDEIRREIARRGIPCVELWGETLNDDGAKKWICAAMEPAGVFRRKPKIRRGGR